jgi:hypothetical protein
LFSLHQDTGLPVAQAVFPSFAYSHFVSLSLSALLGRVEKKKRVEFLQSPVVNFVVIFNKTNCDDPKDFPSSFFDWTRLII